MLERAESFNCRPAEGYGHTKLNKTSELLIEHQFIKLKRHHAKASTNGNIRSRFSMLLLQKTSKREYA